MELVTRMVQAAADSAPVAARPCVVALAIPTLNEEASIGDVLRAVPRGVVTRIIVADGGSTDATVARAPMDVPASRPRRRRRTPT